MSLSLRTLILRTEDLIASGAYADIFRPPGSKLAYQLFVSGKHPTTASQGLTRPEDDERRRKTFISECEAYDRVTQDPFLRHHTPHSFGRCTVADVLRSTKSVADLYMLDHCYVMEYIEGNAKKLGECPVDSCPDHIERALNAFRNIGIFHLIDTSVFFLDDPDNFKFIDFAIEEFQAYWCGLMICPSSLLYPVALNKYGNLTVRAGKSTASPLRDSV
jgi:hypothetical protein